MLMIRAALLEGEARASCSRIGAGLIETESIKLNLKMKYSKMLGT